MKKKFLAFILSAAMATLLLTGCSGGGSSGTVPGGTQTSSNGKVSIKMLGASWEELGGYMFVYYSAEVTNGNSQTAGGCAVTVTSRNQDGKVLDVSTMDGTGLIASGDTIRYSGKTYYVGEAPATVELSIGSPYGYNNNYGAVARSSELKPTNIALINGSKITGDLVNDSSVTPTNVRVSVLFKQNGKYIGGDSTWVNHVQPNGVKAAFEVYIPDCCEGFDSYEVVAAQW